MLDLMPTAESTTSALSDSTPLRPSTSTTQRPSAPTTTLRTVVEVSTVARSLRKTRSIVFDTSSSSSGMMRGRYSTSVTLTPSVA